MNKDFFYLVTTADENTWPENSRILFIGEWCKRYSRKVKWSKLDAELLSYHWDDRDKLLKDYQYLLALHESLLENITVDLNKLHSVSHSLRYWRILVGPWLGFFTQILFDRWSSVSKAVKEYDLTSTIIYTGQEGSIVPNDMNDFLGFMKVNNIWNNYLYSEAIKRCTNLTIIEKDRPFNQIDTKSFPKLAFKSKVKQTLLGIISRFFHLFQKRNYLFLFNTYLNVWDEVKLLFRFRQLPFTGSFKSNLVIPFCGKQREWILSGESKNEFEELLRTLIPKQIPKVYLEGYENIQVHISNLHLPESPKLIWTSNSHIGDDVFKTWTAKQIEMGSKLVIGQHGGHYGIGKFNFTEEHELAICDKYLTWGWLNANEKKIARVGQIKSKKPLKIKHSNQPNLLLVTNIVPPLSCQLYSCTLSRQWLDYFYDQVKFVNALPENLKEVVLVRIIPWEWGWDQEMRWNHNLPGIKIDNGFTRIDKLIKTTRLYISTYNATTFLETFTMNVPTIIFWNPLQWELRDIAVPFFEELKRVNIFHETAESAALHVAAVWDDVDAWWDSAEVTEVLEQFKKQYCDLSTNLVGGIDFFLRQTIKELKNPI